MLYLLNEFKRGTEAAFVTGTVSEHSNLIWQTTVNLKWMERFQIMANMKQSKLTAFFFTKPGSLKFFFYAVEYWYVMEMFITLRWWEGICSSCFSQPEDRSLIFVPHWILKFVVHLLIGGYWWRMLYKKTAMLGFMKNKWSSQKTQTKERCLK